MNFLAVISALLAIVFVVLLLQVWQRLKKRKLLSAGLYLLPTTIVVSSLFVLLLILSNLTTYQRLTYERDIAQLAIVKVSEQNYRINLSYLDSISDEATDTFNIQGDEWRLEARILKWQGWANLLGLDSYYQLDRMSGRYRDIEQATSRPVSAFSLAKPQRGISLWRLKRLMKSNLPFLDAYYGQAVFLPMHDGAVFSISINQTGLIARPANEIAQQALDDW